jgi:protein-disulfide isomerase
MVVAPPVSAEPDADPIATLNGEPITQAEVEARTAAKLYRLRWEIYDTLSTEAKALADERLLAEEAERRGMTVDEMLRVEVERNTQPPTDEEVSAFIEENDVPSATAEDTRSRIRVYLADRAAIQRKLDFLNELRAKATYQFLLYPPERPQVPVSVDDDPMQGAPNAPVTIIHFASFACDHCAESSRNIQRLFDEFPGAIRWVHRDFLNLFDERGLRAAEAGETAHAQGWFWEFHDAIYALSGDFDADDLDGILERAGVGPSAYERAHATARYIQEIRHDIEDGARAGVTGVPAIFINGRFISGTFSYDRLKEMVEEELQVQGSQAKQDASAP